MKISSVVIFIILFLSSIANSKDQFVSEEETSIILKSVGPNHGDVARFNGSEIISGKYVIGWRFLDDEPYQLEARLYPDEKTVKILPHEKGKDEVVELYLAMPEKSAKLILSGEVYKKLLKKKVMTVSGEVTVKINDYSSAIDCDNRWYRAHVLSVITPDLATRYSSKPNQYGC